MNDYGMARAQSQYDAQEPPEGPRRCQCSHDVDDHNGAPDPERMQLALIEISRIAKGQGNNYPPSMYAFCGQLLGIAELALSICSDENCSCRQFEAADPHED